MQNLVVTAGRQKGLGLIPLRFSLLFRKVVVCGHSRVTLSITVNGTLKWLIAAHLNVGVQWNIKMALIAAHLNVGVQWNIKMALVAAHLNVGVQWNIKMASVAAHLNAGVILVVTVYTDWYIISLPLPPPPFSTSLTSLLVSVAVKHHGRRRSRKWPLM